MPSTQAGAIELSAPRVRASQSVEAHLVDGGKGTQLVIR
jgi:hypothetical protein